MFDSLFIDQLIELLAVYIILILKKLSFNLLYYTLYYIVINYIYIPIDYIYIDIHFIYIGVYYLHW